MSDPTYRLLRELAGRVDDDLLATGRELVAVGEEGHALELLVAELVAERAVLPHAVRSELVAEAAARRVQPDADACLPPAADVAAGPHRFDGDGPPGAAEAVTAALAGVPVPESGWTLAWRTTPAGAAPGPLPQPVLLARTGPHDAPEVLTYQAQAALARAGLVVSVEVGDDSPDPDYHRAAREVARPLPAAASSAPSHGTQSHDSPSHDTPSHDAPFRDVPSRDDVSAEGALPAGNRPVPPISAPSSDRAPGDRPDDRPSARAGLVPAAVPPDPRPDRDAPSTTADPGPDALGGPGSDAAPAFDAVPARDRADGSPLRPGVDADVPDPGRSPAPIPDDRPAPRTDSPSAEAPGPADRPGRVDPVSTGGTTTSPGTSGPGDRPGRTSDAAASRAGADPGTPATGSATSPSDATGPGPDTGTSADTAHGPETATADPTIHGPETGTPDGADPGPARSRGPAARPVAVPAENEDTAHPAPRPSPPIRALREATGGDWFDSPPEAGSPNPTPASGVGEVPDVPRHRFVAESTGPGNGHSPDHNGAHPATADRGPVAEPPERPVAPDPSPSDRPPGPSDGPSTPPVTPARPGPPASRTAPGSPIMPESPTTPVPPVAAADPSPVGRRSTRRDLGVPPRGAAGRAPAGDGPAPVVVRPPVGAPAAPGPDEASWLADWASGAWVGEIPPPEPPARTDRTDVDRTVPGTPHVVPAANGTAPASSETPEDPDHAAPAPHARAGLPDTGPAPDEAGTDPVDEAPTPPPGVLIRRAPAPPARADGDRRPRHLLLTDDEPDEPQEPDEPVADTTEPADVVAPTPATDQPAPRPPEEPATGLAAGSAEAPAPRPRPRPRPAGGLADRLTPTEQDLLQRLHEELAARENGGEPTPRNGTARTDRG